jgi:hypothetical protein
MRTDGIGATLLKHEGTKRPDAEAMGVCASGQFVVEATLDFERG